MQNENILRIYDTALDMGEINKALVMQDITVVSSSVCNDTLEDYFKKITGEDIDAVKIVTLAPELDKNGELVDFLESHNIRAHAGHTLAESLYNVSATTHHFNAMEPITHKRAILH